MIRFSSGLWLNRESLQQGGFGPLASTIFGFAQSLKALDTDEAEFAMLSAICLISGGKLFAGVWTFVGGYRRGGLWFAVTDVCNADRNLNANSSQ